MRRNRKSLLVVVTLALALLLTVTVRDPHGLRLSAGEPLGATPPPVATSGKKYDLSSLHVFNATLMRINDSYVDPARVDPKQMLLSALDQVQKSVAEVLVEPHPEEDRIVVRVDTVQKEFRIGCPASKPVAANAPTPPPCKDEVDSPWALSLKMREIFRFIGDNIQPGTDAKELEYAATNGMLSTLDPHSVLLEPAVYNEMRLNTRGNFGGLGIVIGIRKGALTVLKPMPNTPASLAGLKAGDRIVRIEKESTVNMMLNDAVNRLRGEPNTEVEIWVQRGDVAAKRYRLTRAVIQVKTIEARALKNNIAYVKLLQFAGNSVSELARSLDEMKSKGGVKGIILDLRGDPGGLLDQAIKVADEFVESGTIVTTVDNARKTRKEERATPGNQPHVPMAVLVDGSSASASEIVAGALKNLDRAVVIGSRTFGKGSVQVLYDNDDGSALKLTIAQYLTPGDVSIQSVGIMPDIVIEAAALSKERASVFRPRHGLREQDLDAHLTSRNAQEGDKPIETVRYLSEQPKKREPSALLRDDSKSDPDDPEAEPEEDLAALDNEEFKEDYEIVFARDLLVQAKGWRRRELLASSRGYFDHKLAEEQTKIAEGLKKLGVEWAQTGSSGGADLLAELSTDKPNHQVAAGDSITLKATVQNRGAVAASQVRAITKSDDPLMEDREFFFGQIGPGESRTWTVPVKIDRAALSRLDLVKLDLADARGTRVNVSRIELRVDGLPRPRFAYGYQLIDDVKGNGDGQAQRVEEVRLHVTVNNIGEGKVFQTLATLANKSGEGVDVGKGRFQLGSLAPGESKAVDFTFTVGEYKEDKFALEMDVYDETLHELVTDKLNFPVAPGTVAVEAASGGAGVLAEQAEVRTSVAGDAQVVGYAPKGSVFRVTGRTADALRVEIEPGRSAFVAAKAASLGKSPAKGAMGKFSPLLQVAPPHLEIVGAPLAVDAPAFHLNAGATDEHQVADGYVFVSNRGAKIDRRKVFYRSNRNGAAPKQMKFDADIPLWPGANTVTVVVRQSNQVLSQQTLIVHRRPVLAPVSVAK